MTDEERLELNEARRGAPAAPARSAHPDATPQSGGDPPSDPPGYLEQFRQGVRRGGYGSTVYGAEQALSNIPGLERLRPSAADKEYVDRPDVGWSETAGRWVGGAAPYAAASLVGAPLLGLAGRAAIGGIAGGLQPTEGGSWKTHAADAAAGALASIVPFAPRNLLHAGDALTAWAATFPAKAMVGQHAFWEWPLYDAVRRIGPISLAAAFARRFGLSGAAGAAGGKAAQKGQEALGVDQQQ